MSFLGIDVGTSGTKLLLTDATGDILAKTTIEYPCASPKPRWSEQDPADWWDAVCRGTRRVLSDAGVPPSDVQALSFCGQMVGLVALDRGGRVIRPCILWNDQRSAEVTDALTRDIGLDTILQETSNPLFASFVAPKLVGMRASAGGALRHGVPLPLTDGRVAGSLRSMEWRLIPVRPRE